MTSIPTKYKPSRCKAGATWVQIKRSRSVSFAASTRPPTAILPRNSDPVGTRLMAPIGSPFSKIIRLSPSFASGKNC